MSKSKGSRYERELVDIINRAGSRARRVPLSGSMRGYKGDVVVLDEIAIECKYSANGSGFKRLVELVEPGTIVEWVGADYALEAWHVSDWIHPLLLSQHHELWEQEFGRAHHLPKHVEVHSGHRMTFVRNAIDQAEGVNWAALRMPRHDWVMVALSGTSDTGGDDE